MKAKRKSSVKRVKLPSAFKGIILSRNPNKVSIFNLPKAIEDFNILNFEKSGYVPPDYILSNIPKTYKESAAKHNRSIVLDRHRIKVNPLNFSEAFKKKYWEMGSNVKFLGLEWETSYQSQSHGYHETFRNWLEKDNNLETVKSMLPYFNFREDDSSMFEMVSIPATCCVLKEILSSTFFGVNSVAYKDLRKVENCGMHVHISRTAFKNNYHMLCLYWFINSSFNSDFIDAVAGRKLTDTEWCRPVYMGPVYDENKKLLGFNGIRFTKNGRDYTINPKESQGKGLFSDIYTEITDANGVGFDVKTKAVNTGYAQTVEIRIFASPNNQHELFAKLEFVDCLIRFTEQVKDINEVTVSNFIKYLYKGRTVYHKTYNNLKEYIAILGYS